MELEALRKDMVAAMKAKDKVTKEAVSSLISAVKKVAIDEGCRDDISSELVDRVILKELKSVKEQAQIPIMMGFGIRTTADVEPMKDIIDGAIVGSHFINLMEENQYDLDVAKEYIQTFKSELK